MKLKKYMSVDLEFSKFEIEKVNPLFSKAKIYVMYHGENRNGTNIPKDVVEKSLHSIKNIPIVGEFRIQDNGEGNFGGHGGELVLSDDGVEWIETTKPVGVVPSDARVYWEIVKDDKDREREYLIVDGAYLWNRYQDEILTLKKDNFGQSMEIEVLDGEFDEEKELYDIKEFLFSALCILGIDKDGHGHVEPAFEDAKIITYNLDKNDFKSEFSELMKELKYEIKELDEKGVENKVLEDVLKKYKLTVDDLKAKDIDYEKLDNDDLEKAILDNFNTQEDESTDSDDVEDTVVESDDPEKEDVEEAEAEDDADNIEDEEDIEEEENSDEDYEFKINELTNQVLELKKENKDLKMELKELQKFKSNTEKELHEDKAKDLFNKFNLQEDEIANIDIHSMSIEDIEKECYAIIGKRYANFSLQDNSLKIPLNNVDKDRNESAYDDLFERYKDN